MRQLMLMVALTALTACLPQKGSPAQERPPQNDDGPGTPSVDDPDDGQPLVITGISLEYGSNAGGDSVELFGEGFDAGMKVFFGAAEATIAGRTADTLLVKTPASIAEGPVDITVVGAGGNTTLDRGFVYFADAEGWVTSMGSLSRVQYLGDYWSDAQDYASMWWAPIAPSAADSQALFYASSLGNCHSDYVSAVGVDTTEPHDAVSTLLGDELELDPVWDADEAMFWTEFDSADWAAGASLDLVDFDFGDGVVADVPDFVETPNSFQLYLPALDTDTLRDGTQDDLSFVWSASGADWIAIKIRRTDFGSTVYETVTCAVPDTGAFDVPQTTWQGWDVDDVIRIQIGAARSSTAVLPTDRSSVGVVSIDWRLGAFVVGD